MANETQADTTDATLTEHLAARDNRDDSIDGHAKITYYRNSANGLWQTDTGEELDEKPEYHVECSCGEEFGRWGAATKHAEDHD